MQNIGINISNELICQIAIPLQMPSRTQQTYEQQKAIVQAKPKQTRKRKLKTKSSYNWSVGECRRYLQFLMDKRQIFNLPTQEKRKLKVDILLSKKVNTRTAAQCHTHHQKMLLKYGNIDNIISQLNIIFNLPVKPKDDKQKSKTKRQQNGQQCNDQLSPQILQTLTSSRTDPPIALIKQDFQLDYVYYK